MTIDEDVRAICATYADADSLAEIVQAIVIAEGNIVKAVQCSAKGVTTREAALHVVCRSVLHRMSDFALMPDRARDFVTYFGGYWAPIGVANDPKGLNKNWVPNVTKELGV